MPAPEMNELANYINELIAATRAGTIEWNRANPTTFLSEVRRANAAARLTLQQVDKRERAPANPSRFVVTRTYMLQVHDLSGGGQQRLSVSGAEDKHTNELLKALFESVSSGVTRKGLDFLKSILPPRND